MTAIELWAAAASSAFLVDDRWIDRARQTGHHERLDDLDRLAALGARRVRFPVAWPRVASSSTSAPDWRWSDVRLGRLGELNVGAIVGLLDGSAPAHLDPSDAKFVVGFADWAGTVAERYGWIDDWTPIHAPQAAARRMIGRHDLALFLRTVVRASAAINAAMLRIRAVVPNARLVHTEAIGRIGSTDALALRCAFANDLRWLALDLLCGRVVADHPLRERIERAGIAARELDELVARPCVPDVIGIDYEPGSDRFLDDRLDRWAASTWTGDGDATWAEVPALRRGPIAGHRAALEDVWSRYRRPLALTHSHLGGTREAQMRWLDAAWSAAAEARITGIEVEAVTVSAAFGVVHRAAAGGHYECGAYDVRAGVPRPTAIA
ncbi:MAG TPA: hypothetical protein VFG69_08755, partial [Nannocystaceae bacterium]|nr:hypothetical protein [Nannocystaceae bacterium]